MLKSRIMPAGFLLNWRTMFLAGVGNGKGSQSFVGAQAAERACLEGSSRADTGAGFWIGQFGGAAGCLFRFLVVVVSGLTTKVPLLKKQTGKA